MSQIYIGEDYISVSGNNDDTIFKASFHLSSMECAIIAWITPCCVEAQGAKESTAFAK